MTKILAIDQGTTGTTCLVTDASGKVLGRGYREIRQYYPQNGWVEHDAEEIFESVLYAAGEAVEKSGVSWKELIAIGISNQRETVVVWDAKSGKPVHRAIVWQCRRTAPMMSALKNQGYSEYIRSKTGLVLDAYFSASKLKMILDETDPDRSKANKGAFLCGTIDSWLIWKLTGGQSHYTDFTNASRTMLYNIDDLQWDDALLDLFQVPAQSLPQVKNSSDFFGMTASGMFPTELPITGVAGDQQAALFGHGAWTKGMAKNTYGTGCFLMMNTGQERVDSSAGLLTTLACDAYGKPAYALEGSIFIAGAVVQYLRDELGLIKTAAESESLANSIESTEGVYFIPAFVGLGAPWWNMEVRGMISGLGRGSGKAVIVRAALESIAYQSADLIHRMIEDSGIDIPVLAVDGGAAQNGFLMQFQADLLRIPLFVPENIDVTALGAAALAGLYQKVWASPEELKSKIQSGKEFLPQDNQETMSQQYAGWQETVAFLLRKRD
jgi:glycerol kinase